jgi:IPT/TIG domain/Divergent InlB B-repeat domain
VRGTSKAPSAGSSKRKAHNRGRSARSHILCLLLVFASTACLVPTFASAAPAHPFLENLGSANEPTFTEPQGIAVDQSSGDLLVLDRGAGTLSRWNPDGTPAEFSALAGNEITGFFFGSAAESQVAVDSSGGATDGNIYVAQGSGEVKIFDEDGNSLGQLTESSEGPFAFPCGVAVDPSGNVYVGDFSGAIHKYEPAANPPVNGDNVANFPFLFNCTLAAGAGATDGFIFPAHFFGSVAKLDATTGAEEDEIDPFGSTTTLSVDPATGRILIARGEAIAEFNASGASGAKEVSSTPLASTARGVAIDESTGNLYVTREGSANVEVFGPLVEFPLTIKKGSGGGEGTVQSAPGGISCDPTCAEETADFPEGEVVELEAAPESNSEFSGWSSVSGDPGTCTGTTSPCEVTMSEAVELEADFALLPPAVTAISPGKGPLGGGNEVEITGTVLREATKVEFGTTVVAAPFAENTETAIRLDAPAHEAGTVDVIVTTAVGPSPDTAADDYTYVVAPAVSAVSPTEGSTAGGNEVEITGTDLAEATKVEFGKTVVNAPFTENTATTIKAKAPGHAAGTFDVIVSTAGGASVDTPADDYTYVATPAVTALSPAKGPTTGANQVVITGLRLAEATKVEFGTTVVDDAEFAENTATKIKVNAPAHAAGKVNVKVTTLGGTSGNFSVDDYTYEVPTPVSPPAGGTGGGLGAVSGPPPLQCVVPKLKGLRPSKARSALAAAHCKTGEVSKPKARKGKGLGPLVVRSSKPGAGATLPAEGEVDLRLGSKPRSNTNRGGAK